MAVRMSYINLSDDEHRAILKARLSWFVAITDGRDAWEFDAPEILYARSAAEFVRDDLDAEALTYIGQGDAYWKANPKAFNEFFKYEHAGKDAKTELSDSQFALKDEHGNTPRIPRSHWWWWPLAVNGEV